MRPDWVVKKMRAWGAPICSLAMLLAFGGAALRGQQVPQETPPAGQTPAPPPQAAAQSDSGQQPETPRAPERKSPLDDLDDLEAPAKALPPPAPVEAESLHVLWGRPLVVTSPAAIQRLSVAAPNIVDLVVLSNNEILVNGKQRGRVALVVRDVTGQSQEFDINVECDPPALPEQLLTALAAQPASAEAPRQANTWIYLLVVGSIILVGGTVLGARRHHVQRLFKLESGSRGESLAGLGLRSEAAGNPQEWLMQGQAEVRTVSPASTGIEAVSLGHKRAIAERNQRLLEAFLEAATRGVFPAGPEGRRAGSSLAQKTFGAPPAGASGHQPGDAFGEAGASALQPQPLLDTVTALAFAVDNRGPYATGHSQAVSRLAARIAVQAGLSVSEVEETRLAGLVHDIGKLQVPESLCNKPDRLTPEEFETMSRHSAWGAEILRPLHVKAVERIVRHHHERFDGNGYPDRLAAEKIPLGARIVAVAESFHSMLCDLPYKSAATFEDALAELRRCSGLQFDPKIVMVFLDWIQSFNVSPKHQKA